MIQLQEKQATKLSNPSSSPSNPSPGSTGWGIIGVIVIVLILSSCISGLFKGAATAIPTSTAAVSSSVVGTPTKAPETQAGLCEMRVPNSNTQNGDTAQLDGSTLLASSQTIDDTNEAQRKFVEAFHISTENQNPESRGWALEGILCTSKRRWTIEVANAVLALPYKQAQPTNTIIPKQKLSVAKQLASTQQATAQGVPTPTIPLQAAAKLEQACTSLIREVEMVQMLANNEGLQSRVKNVQAIPSKASLCRYTSEFKLHLVAQPHTCSDMPYSAGGKIPVKLTLKLEADMHAEFALVHLGGHMVPLFVDTKQTLMQAHTYLSRTSAQPAATYEIETEAYVIRRMQPFEIDVVEGESPKNMSITLSDGASLIVAECGTDDVAATAGHVCKMLDPYIAPTQL